MIRPRVGVSLGFSGLGAPRSPGDTEASADPFAKAKACLLYTSDAADERSSVDLGGRRIIKKKKTADHGGRPTHQNEHRPTASAGSYQHHR